MSDSLPGVPVKMFPPCCWKAATSVAGSLQGQGHVDNISTTNPGQLLSDTLNTDKWAHTPQAQSVWLGL